MNSDKPEVRSVDDETRITLVGLSRDPDDPDDPRLDVAHLLVKGPGLEAESSIDAYMIEDFAKELFAVVTGEKQSAATLAGEIRFENAGGGEIAVVLAGGAFRNGGDRPWSLRILATVAEAKVFAERLASELGRTGRTV